MKSVFSGLRGKPVEGPRPHYPLRARTPRYAILGAICCSKYHFIRPKGPCGTLFRLEVQSYTLRAARRPCLYALAIPAPPPSTRDATVSFLLTRAMGPKGIKWDPRGGPKGAFGALWRDGPRGAFGVIPKPFRMESHFEWKVWKVITNGRPFRYQSHFKAE